MSEEAPQVIPTASTPAQAVKAPQNPVKWAETGVQLQSMEDAYRFAVAVAASPFVPKGMEKPGDILVALQAGAEMGLSPMQSLQSIAIVNGRPSIYGDAALALVRASGLLSGYSAEMSGDGDNRACTVTVKRGAETHSSRFSVADAKRAGLWDKPGPWKQYPDRMLMFRARGFVLRDAFSDVLKGLRTSEEVADLPRENIRANLPAALPGFNEDDGK